MLTETHRNRGKSCISGIFPTAQSPGILRQNCEIDFTFHAEFCKVFLLYFHSNNILRCRKMPVFRAEKTAAVWGRGGCFIYTSQKKRQLFFFTPSVTFSPLIFQSLT